MTTSEIIDLMRFNPELATILVNTFEPKEMLIFISRHGIFGLTPRTYQEIGAIFKITKEAVRQKVCRCDRLLRHPSRRKYINSFLQTQAK